MKLLLLWFAVIVALIVVQHQRHPLWSPAELLLQNWPAWLAILLSLLVLIRRARQKATGA